MALGAYAAVVKIVIWVLGVERALHLLGFRPTTLFAAGSIFAIGTGLAAKGIVENFLFGGILRIEKAVRPGDLDGGEFDGIKPDTWWPMNPIWHRCGAFSLR